MTNKGSFKVLFVIGSLRVGGAESQMVLLVQQLIKENIDCEVFAMKAEGELLDRLKSSGVLVYDGCYRSSESRLYFLWQTLRLVFQLIRILVRGRFHCLHAYLPTANFIGSLAGKLAQTHLVITSRRALGTHQDRSKLWKFFDYIANLCSDKVTVNSKAVWDDVLARDGISEKKLKLIYNGLHLKPFVDARTQREKVRKKLGVDESTLAVTMVANLIPYKGHQDVVRAIPDIVSIYPNIHFFFAGDDRGIQKHLDQLASELGVSKYITYLGRWRKVPELLTASDIGLVASHEEGFCNALLEMMASALPVVATTVGGNKEALNGGELGLLIPAKDSEAIARAVVQFASNNRMRKEIGDRACVVAMKNYTTKRMVKQYIDLYQEAK